MFTLMLGVETQGGNMVKYVIAEQLIGKRVMTNDGFELGQFVDAELNEVTGKLTALILEPNVDSEFVNKLEVKSGKLRVDYGAVLAVNDLIVVDRRNM